MYNQKKNLSILDICAGTGGELFGLLYALKKNSISDMNISLTAWDGNSIALNYLSRILSCIESKINYSININYIEKKISSQDDLLLEKSNEKYDIIICSKFIAELIHLQKLKEHGYRFIIEKFIQNLSEDGLFIITDITTKDDYYNKYYPQMFTMDINSFLNKNTAYRILLPLSCSKYQNCSSDCFMQKKFIIHHSLCRKDTTKICYKIIGYKDYLDKIIKKPLKDYKYIICDLIDNKDEETRYLCKKSLGCKYSLDAFNLNFYDYWEI